MSLLGFDRFSDQRFERQRNKIKHRSALYVFDRNIYSSYCIQNAHIFPILNPILATGRGIYLYSIFMQGFHCLSSYQAWPWKACEKKKKSGRKVTCFLFQILVDTNLRQQLQPGISKGYKSLKGFGSGGICGPKTKKTQRPTESGRYFPPFRHFSFKSLILPWERCWLYRPFRSALAAPASRKLVSFFASNPPGKKYSWKCLVLTFRKKVHLNFGYFPIRSFPHFFKTGLRQY